MAGRRSAPRKGTLTLLLDGTIDKRSLVTGMVSFLLIALVASWLGLGPQLVLPWRRSAPPPPTLSDFLEEEMRVTSTLHIEMDGSKPPEIVIAALRRGQREIGLVPGTIILLAWDSESSRWTKVFDAATYPAPHPFEDGEGLFDDYRYPAELKILPLASRSDKASDLAFSANMASGAGVPGQIVGILRFEHDVSELIYNFDSWGSGTIEVSGEPGNQALKVKTNYYSPIDAHCCPTRDYSFRVEVMDDGYYKVTEDDRPWTGAYILRSGRGRPFVLAVTPGTPAAQSLQPGDIVIGLSSSAPRVQDPEAFLGEIAKRFPGDTIRLMVERGDATVEVSLKLTSRAHEYDFIQFRPWLPDLGWTVAQQNDHVQVVDVRPLGPADETGIRVGTRVVELNNHRIDSAYELYRLLMEEDQPFKFRLRDAAGTERVVELQNDFGSGLTAIDEPFGILVPL